jgi:hypothetical protein
MFYELVPHQVIIAQIKSRAYILEEQALATANPWDSFVRNVLEEFWSYVKANVCNEDAGVVAKLTGSTDNVDGLALQIFYTPSIANNDAEFQLQQNIYLNLFNLMQSALGSVVFGVSAFSFQKKIIGNQWCSFMGFKRV